MNPSSQTRSVAIGIACGIGAAVFWAAGFVAARHGIDIGFTPADLTFHRCFWAGLVLLPLAWRDGLRDLNGVGWGRGVVLTFLGAIGISYSSYSGFLLVPLGHGGIIQPSTAALLGLVLSALVLHERLPPRRAAGAAVIVAGLVVIGGEAIATIGTHGVAGDLLFVLAGTFFGTFGMLLRKWRVPATRAMVVVSVVSLAILPIFAAVEGLRPHGRARLAGEPAAGAAARAARRPRRDLSVHPLGGAARRRPGVGVSDPGAALRAADRLDRTRLGAEPPADRRPCHRADRIPIDAARLIHNSSPLLCPEEAWTTCKTH